mmetsp:Transcript_24205/g.60096  ORF Transcript_24205/g.60096 Transcript_24205/m.60096 type:complete len:225 (+) Transcript_24205:2740-3414(+)
MVDADAELQRVLERRVSHLRHVSGELIRWHVHEAVRALVRGGVRDEVNGGQARLTARRHEHQRRLLRRVRADRGVRWFVHGGHPGAVELSREALDVTLERHGAHRGAEVEEPLIFDAEPVTQVPRVGKRRGQPHNAHWVVGPRRDVPHTRYDDFENGPAVGTQQMNFVDHHQCHLGDVRARLPVATDAVPLLWGGDDDVRVEQCTQVRGVVPSQLHQPLAQHRT